MNREDAKELLPLIEAFANGEDIECVKISDGTWKTMGANCRFDSAASHYRIKPKPREFWIHNETLERDCLFQTLDHVHAPNDWIKVREVL